jgi:uncharacterized protein
MVGKARQNSQTRDQSETPIKLSIGEARGVMLAAQGLFGPPPAQPGMEEVQAIVDRLGAVQIDTIQVIERSQYLVLWSRLGVFDPALLDALLATRRSIFEYWSHAASIVPMQDYPYYRLDMVRAYAHHLWSDILDWMQQNPEVVEQTLSRIRDAGPMASADFESPQERRPTLPWEWYGPKLSRRALHTLWTTGDLMISSRRGGQKVYDLRERILAEAANFGVAVPNDDALPTLEEQALHFVERTVRALGIVTPSWLWDYFRMRPELQAAASDGRRLPARLAAKRTLDGLAERGLVLGAQVAGWDEPAYLDAERMPDLLRQRAGDAPARTTLLSPFDNLIWHRERTRALFDYEVSFEAYVAPEKRRYGYYCLAILHGGRIVGRIDVKALRMQRQLLAHAVYLEPGVKPDERLVVGIVTALADLARFLKLETVSVDRAEPKMLLVKLNQLLPGAEVAQVPAAGPSRRP